MSKGGISLNTLELTDNEIALIATALTTTIASTQKYIQIYGKDNSDNSTLSAFKEMKELLRKIEMKYF